MVLHYFQVVRLQKTTYAGYSCSCLCFIRGLRTSKKKKRLRFVDCYQRSPLSFSSNRRATSECGSCATMSWALTPDSFLMYLGFVFTTTTTTATRACDNQQKNGGSGHRRRQKRASVSVREGRGKRDLAWQPKCFYFKLAPTRRF